MKPKGWIMHENVKIQFTICLTIKAPFLSQASTAGKVGIDASLLRNQAGIPYIPGSLVKGCLWESMIEIHDFLDITQDQIIALFGEESEEHSYNHPTRGKLSFSDFILQDDKAVKQSEDSALNFRIKMDHQRGAVDNQALMIMEMPFKHGQELQFKGNLTLYEKKSLLDPLQTNLFKAFQWIPALGSHRGIGFGEIIHVSMDHDVKTFTMPSLSESKQLAERYVFSFKPQAPFCVTGHMPVGNMFTSETIISGAVIKGTIAGSLNRLLDRNIDDPITENTLPEDWQLFGKYFHQLHMSHAFPVNRTDHSDIDITQRPQTIPLSIFYKDDQFFDAYIPDNFPENQAPKFQSDWKPKDYSKANTLFQWPDLSDHKDLRVRTAIDYSTQRSKDQQLFSIECIVPDAFEWLGWWDTHKIDDQHRDQITMQLQQLLDFGLTGFSKTKTNVIVDYTSHTASDSQTDDILSSSKQWAFTLQTPALMFNPEEIAGPEKCNGVNLNKAYQAYFMNVSDNSLKLVDFFASQSFRGRYLFYHFKPDAPYNPFVITDAGSVFIVETVDQKHDQAIQFIKNSMRFGLPLPDWAITGNAPELLWQTCPWVPENGFGEIVFNKSFEGRLKK
jgi:hypothetical protein